MKEYGWGFLDKNGPTKYFMSAGNESLLVYKVALLNREKPDAAPFRVVPLFYKEEGE